MAAQKLQELGSKLDPPPSSKDALAKLLKQALTCLTELDQSPAASILESMKPLMNAVVKPELLKHQDRDVKLLVATCVCEVTRITAPEAPYDDDVLKDVFQLIVGTFSGLTDTTGPSFGRRVVILETLAKYRSCVVLLDLECDDLVNKMFNTFFAVARDEHPENVLSSMQTIMVVLLEESEDIREDLLFIVLSKLGRNREDVSNASRKLAMNVIESCAAKLEPVIKQLIVSSMSGESEPSNEQTDYHEVIYDLYRCAPQILSGVIPHLTGELLTDQLDVRLKAVTLVGDLFSIPGLPISETFQPVFLEFLKRLSDRSVEIRLSVLQHVKNCLLSDPSRTDAPQIISALCDRLLDYDENVRKQVVGVICDLACHSPNSVPVETVILISDRLRDKSALVKKFTMEKLADIFRVHLTQSNELVDANFDWIPGKILRCFYDKDFRSEMIESVLYHSLFPEDMSIKGRVKCWVKLFSRFDKVEIKVLERILEQKQRLQQEMQRYLLLRQTYQTGDASETQKKVQFCFRVMSRFFADPAKAEENFQTLDKLKDSNVWKLLESLLDPNTSYSQSSLCLDDLLKILGEKHPLYDFLSNLSVKCSYILFNKEHVKEILLEASETKSAGGNQHLSSCLSILVMLARYCPSLWIGYEEELVSFLKDENDIVKEGALHILAKAGGIVREQLAALSSSVDLILEHLCLEGSRRQAKYAVHALAAITKDDGLKSLSVLYKRLVVMLDEKTHLPSVLQSLGCIAQTAMPVFETREKEIEEIIKSKILCCSNKVDGDKKTGWDDRSEQCLLKIYGIKTLVKSYLPVKDAHLRPGIESLLEILRNVLSFGEIAQDIESSPVDKAHMKLASAKAILRLSKYWDHKIPMDIFHLTIRTPEIGFPQASKLFLSKIHQYIKDRLLDIKYACAFLYAIDGSKASEFEEERQYLAEILQIQNQSKVRQQSTQNDAAPVNHPEHILSHVVHALAHQSCPDIDQCREVVAYESLYWQLYLIISMLVHGDEDGKLDHNGNKEQEILSVTGIFQTIKRSEDASDASKSMNSHAICDIGLSVVKRLSKADISLEASSAPASLPPALYKLYERTEKDESEGHGRKTWLADESVYTHFNSLKLEINSNVPAESPGDTDLKENEKDGSELPLKKMIKRLKSHGTKNRKGQPAKSEKKKAENDIDVLKMVREINLDSMGLSGKFDPSNGHDLSPNESMKGDNVHENGDKSAANVASLASIPKRQRSSSAQSPTKRSKNIARISEDKASLLKRFGSSPDSVTTASGFSKRSLSKNKGKGSYEGETDKPDEVGEINDDDLKIEKLDTQKSSDSSKKKKRKIMGGLTKCTMMGTESLEDLIGCKIKVWWPMDKQFYGGTIKSYDPSRNKHVILYDDGDVEILNLEKERWELIDKRHKTAKRSKSAKTTPSKRVVNAKGTPKKQKQSALVTNSDQVEDKHRASDLSEVELSTSSRDDHLNFDDLGVDQGLNKRKASKLKRKPISSDEETDGPVQDDISGDDEGAPINRPRKKRSDKKSRSRSEGKKVQAKKRRTDHKIKETSDEDGSPADHPMEDDKIYDDENVLVSSAKKGPSKRARSNLKRKPSKGMMRKLDLLEATGVDEGPGADIQMQDAEDSADGENIMVKAKKGSNKKTFSKPKRKAVRDDSDSAGLADTSEEEAEDDVQGPTEDDRRSDEEKNPSPTGSDQEQSNSEAKTARSKRDSWGKTSDKSQDSSEDEKTEIPDDEPLKLWKKRAGKSLKK